MKMTHSTYRYQADNNNNQKKNSHRTNNGTDKQCGNAVKRLTSHFFPFGKSTHIVILLLYQMNLSAFDNKLPQKWKPTNRRGGWIFSHTKRKQTQHSQNSFFFFGFYFNCTCWLCIHLLKYFTLRCDALSPFDKKREREKEKKSKWEKNSNSQHCAVNCAGNQQGNRRESAQASFVCMFIIHFSLYRINIRVKYLHRMFTSQSQRQC